MFSRKLWRQKANTPIVARSINQAQRVGEALAGIRFGWPMRLSQPNGVPLVSWDGPIVDVQFFAPTQGPIPAATGSVSSGSITPGQGKGQRWYLNPTTGVMSPYTNEQPETLYNWAPFAVGSANSLVPCYTVDGVFFVANDACPTS